MLYAFPCSTTIVNQKTVSSQIRGWHNHQPLSKPPPGSNTTAQRQNEDPPSLKSNTSIKINRQTFIPTRHVVRPRPPHNISSPLPNLLVLPIDSRLIGPAHPVPHRRRQRPAPVRLVLHRRIRRSRENIFREAVAPATPVRGANGRGPIAALLETNVPVRGAVVVGGDLELGPGGGELGAALDAALEGFGEGDEGGGVCVEGDDGVWAVEVCARGAVAVPVVVVEGV